MIIDVNKLKEEIGEKLREARERRGISQEELAKMLGLSKVGYGALERGKNLIGLQHLIALVYILNEPITAFLPDYVTGTERNSPMLDPFFQQIADCWSFLTYEDKEAVAYTTNKFKEMRQRRAREQEENSA